MAGLSAPVGIVFGLALDFPSPLPRILLASLQATLGDPSLGDYVGLSAVVHATSFFIVCLLLLGGLGYAGYQFGSRLNRQRR